MDSNTKAWRAVLYSNYSAHFKTGKEYHPELHYPLFEQTYKDILPSVRHGAVLDLGCGRGEWLGWMRQNGFPSVSGVDLSDEDLALARKDGIEVHRSDVIDHLSKYSGHFSVIHAKDLIEHLDKSELVILGQTVLKALQPGGVFIATSFNAQAPLAATTRYGDFTHEFGFTPTSLNQWLTACGFTKTTVKGIHICPDGAKGKIRRLLYKPVNRFSSFLLSLRHGKGDPTKLDCSPDLICVATK